MRRRTFLVLFCSAVSVLLAAIKVSAQRPAVDQVWMGPPDLAGSFQPVRELSGRLEVTSFIGPTNPADLQAVCDERRDAEKSALSFDLQNYKARLEGSGRDEKAFVWTAYILAQVRAYFGQMGEATSLLQKARDEVAASAAHNTFPGGPSMFDGLIGVSELRRGEIENCLMHPNAQRRLFTITWDGASRHAIGLRARDGLVRARAGRVAERPRASVAPERRRDDRRQVSRRRPGAVSDSPGSLRLG